MRPRTLVPSAREIQVLEWIAEGKTNAEIGSLLFLAENTVKRHVQHLILKLEGRSRAHIVAIGFQRGYLKVPALEHEASG